jgi:TonB family protein
VLSEATDLHILLDAILGDDVDPVAGPDEPPDVVVLAPVAPWRPATEDKDVEHDVIAEHSDAWGFEGDARHEDSATTADDVSAGIEHQQAPAAPPISRRTWSDVPRAGISKHWVVMATLLAVAFVVVGLSRRDARGDASTPPPSTPAIVESSVAATRPIEQAPSPVGGPLDVQALRPSESERPAAGNQPKKMPRVVDAAPANSQRQISSERTNAQPAPSTRDARDETPAAASPQLTSRDAVERTPDAPVPSAIDPAGNAIPNNATRAGVSAEPAGAPTAARLTNAPAAAPISAAAVPAAMTRTAPRRVTGGAPGYPDAARTARIGGTVEVRFTVDASGRVTSVRAVSGPPQLRQVAEAAVRRWRYQPGRVGNRAVETETSVNFSIDPAAPRAPRE